MNERTIWNKLISAGMTFAGIAGLMGNLYAESALNPKNLQQTYEKSLGYSDDSYTSAVDSGKYTNFSHDSAGYGLAQWTFWTRKQSLLTFGLFASSGYGVVKCVCVTFRCCNHHKCRKLRKKSGVASVTRQNFP